MAAQPKFTPGPWDVRGHWGTFIYCIHDREGQSITTDEQQANLRLVAAAPRMYEELAKADALLRQIEDFFLGMKRGVNRPLWFDKVQDTIAGTSGALRKADGDA